MVGIICINRMDPIFKTEIKDICSENFKQDSSTSLPPIEKKSRKIAKKNHHYFQIAKAIPELKINLPIIRSRDYLPKAEKKMMQTHYSDVRDFNMENWLQVTSKFPEGRWSIKEKRTLWKLFNSIDEDGSGEVDVDELADPLLSSGIAKTMGEVRALVRSVDEDNSGSIGFIEFLHIMRPKSDKNESTPSTKHVKKTKLVHKKMESMKQVKEYRINSQRNVKADPKNANGTKISNQYLSRRHTKKNPNRESKRWMDTISNIIDNEDNHKNSKFKSIRKMTQHHKRLVDAENEKQTSHMKASAPNNPIARLQKMQQQNGNMDIKSVLTVKRRKLLLDATMGEAQRREAALEEIHSWESELKGLHGAAKFKKLSEIHNLGKTLEKTQGEKQHFVAAMQGMIEKELGPPTYTNEKNVIHFNAKNEEIYTYNDESKTFDIDRGMSSHFHNYPQLYSIINERREMFDQNLNILKNEMNKNDKKNNGRQALLIPSTSKNRTNVEFKSEHK